MSMLGILPSGIGIGSGALVTGDEGMIQELMALEKERKGTFGNDAAAFRMKHASMPNVSNSAASQPRRSSGGGGGHPPHPPPPTIIVEEETSTSDPSIKEV